MTNPTTKIDFQRVPNGISVRGVVKAKDRVKTAEDYQREHEIALIKLLGLKHPDIVLQLAEGLAK